MIHREKFRLGLIGHPIQHSKSPEIFDDIFTQEGFSGGEYHLFNLSDLNNFESFLQTQYQNNVPLLGFNVTVPHKTNILSFLQYIDPSAMSVGAVNTVVIDRNNLNKTPHLRGHNTDIIGFDATLKSLLDLHKHRIEQAIILGNGGSAKAVRHVLLVNKIPCSTLHRNQWVSSLNQCQVLQRLKWGVEPIPENTLFINTTPVGMWPNIEQSIKLPWQMIRGQNALIDLIYNPKQTQLMHEFQSRNLTAINGEEMLKSQAKASWYLFKQSL